MANKYLEHRFSLREMILLAILVIVVLVGLYFGLVFYPISTRTADLQDQLAETEVRITVANSLKAEYDRIVAELEEIKKSGDETLMPEYKNNEQQEKLAAVFTTIFAGMESDISYGTPSAPDDNDVRTRTITFNFTVNEANKGKEESVYYKVKSVLTQLVSTGFRCSMTTLTLSPGSGDLANDTSVRVSTTINFYELDSNA